MVPAHAWEQKDKGVFFDGKLIPPSSPKGILYRVQTDERFLIPTMSPL